MIKKFHIQSTWYNFTLDPNYIEKLRFPIRKQAEDISLYFSLYADPKKNKLPDFFFNNAFLIKLRLNGCSLFPNGRVNWECLKYLCIDSCRFSNEAIVGVLSGSPLLESLDINYCDGFGDLLTIASKSLKKLVLDELPQRFFLEVRCPNLVEFHATTKGLIGGHLSSTLSDGAIHENYNLRVNPLHELLELNVSDGFSHLVIDLNSLKKLVLDDTTGFTDEVLISCPNLEDLYLCSLSMDTIKFVNIPSSVYATLGYSCQYMFSDDLVRKIFEQLHHVKELNVACCFIRVLSGWEIRGVSCPSINSKNLTLLDCGCQFVGNLPGIAHALRTSPELEKLVLNMGWLDCRCGYPVSKKKYVWRSKRAVSHLKIVEVYGLSRKCDEELEAALNFVEFVLKNARLLEKIVITLEKRRPDFEFIVSQKLSSFSRLSQNVIVELC